MRYVLSRQGDERSEPATTKDFDSDFDATEWARTWLQSHAEHDRYVLRPDGGGQSTLMIRTIAGQWYAMPLVAPAD